MFGRLFECFRSTWECFTYIVTHLMTAPLQWRADLCSATVLQRAISNLSPPINCDIRSFCRAYDSGAVTTCFNDLGLSRLGYVYTTFSCRVTLSPTAPSSRLKNIDPHLRHAMKRYHITTKYCQYIMNYYHNIMNNHQNIIKYHHELSYINNEYVIQHFTAQ